MLPSMHDSWYKRMKNWPEKNLQAPDTNRVKVNLNSIKFIDIYLSKSNSIVLIYTCAWPPTSKSILQRFPPIINCS